MGGFVAIPPNVGGGVIRPEHLSSRNGRYTFDYFRELPRAIKSDGTTAASGSTGDTNILSTGSANYEYHIKGTQTIIVPKQDATTGYLDISLDQTDNDGVEYIQGGTGVRAKHAYTIGTDKAFFTRAKFSVTDVSGTDELVFGFRKRQAFQAAHGSYTDYAAIGIVTAANPAAIKLVSNLNNAGQAAVDTTQTVADGITITFEVRVSVDGKVTYLINGLTPTSNAAFTFDDTDVVIPMFFYLQATTSPSTVPMQEWETGYQPVKGA